MKIRNALVALGSAVALASLGCSSLFAGFQPHPPRTLHTTLFHIVEPGDTLSHLARRYDVSVEELVRSNGLENPDLLRVGNELVIPLGS